MPWDSAADFVEVKSSLERHYLDGCQALEQRSEEGCETSDVEVVSKRIRHDVEAFRQSLDGEPEEFFTALVTMLRVYFSKNRDAMYSANHRDTMAVLFMALRDEALAFACFERVGRSRAKYEGDLDSNFVDLRSLIQLLDPELFEFMHQNCDLSHLYFTQRWFLTEFTEEFSLSDAAKVYETIWASEKVVTSQFPLFIALSLIQQYRDAIIQLNMAFVDVRNLFCEKAKTHDFTRVLSVARSLVKDLQKLRQKNSR